MGKAYKRMMLLLYAAALLVCGGLRIVFSLFFLDPATGFLNPAAALLELIFHCVLGVGLALPFLISLLKRVENDYPVEHRQRLLSFWMLPVSISIALYSIFGIPVESMLQPGSSDLWKLVFTYADLGLGILTALAFLQACIAGLLRPPRKPWSLLALAPAFWQLVVLVSRFNSYNSPTFIQDNLLTILFMCFSAIFFVGQARVLCGFARKNGRNYAIPSGLATSLCGFLLVAPNAMQMVLNQTLVPPALNLTLWELLYISLVSIYSLGFVISFLRSFQYV